MTISKFIIKKDFFKIWTLLPIALLKTMSYNVNWSVQMRKVTDINYI